MQDYVSPFDERAREITAQAARLPSLKGKRITLLSIRKPKSFEFFAELEQVLTGQYGAIVTHAHKPTFTRPAPEDVLDAVRASSDAVVEALAD